MKQVGSIQVLRGVAALGVVIYHARLELGWRNIGVPLPDLTIGAAGVDVFFVISGFVMVYASRPLFGSSASIGPFLLKRCVRIVPLYWAYTCIRVIYIVVANRHSALLGDLPSHLFFSLSFIPPSFGTFPIIVQGWTLTYEMFFYFCFALCLPLTEVKAIVSLATGLSLIALLGAEGFIQGRASALANPQLFEFVGGMLIARLYESRFRLTAASATALACLAVAALIGTAPVLGQFGVWRGLVWGVPASALVAAYALKRGASSRLEHPFLLRLGDASYSLYLSHMLTFTILSRILLRLAFVHPLGALVYFVVLVTAAVMVGFASYRWLEKPMGSFFAAKLRKHGTGTMSTPRQRVRINAH